MLLRKMDKIEAKKENSLGARPLLQLFLPTASAHAQ